jgi:hypothetical protein
LRTESRLCSLAGRRSCSSTGEACRCISRDARSPATWNEKKLLEGKDPKPVTGRAGFATEGAGNASFDEFVIESP